MARARAWGDVHVVAVAIVVVVSPYTLASLQYRDGARRVFTNQYVISCTECGAPVRCSTSRMACRLHHTKTILLKWTFLRKDDRVEQHYLLSNVATSKDSNKCVRVGEGLRK